MKKNIATIGIFFISQIVTCQVDTINHWYIPKFWVTQFAGDVGMVSTGMGFQNKTQKRNYIFSVGYLPKRFLDKKNDLFTFNSIFQYQPIFLQFEEINVKVTPLVFGIGASISMGKQFTKYHDSNYPQGYYWWPTNFRIIISLGHSTCLQLNSYAKQPFKAIELYSQLTTNDLAIYSYSENTIVKAKHIFHFAFGTKLYFR